MFPISIKKEVSTSSTLLLLKASFNRVFSLAFFSAKRKTNYKYQKEKDFKNGCF